MKTVLLVSDTFGNVHRFEGCGIRAIDSGSTWEVLAGDELMGVFVGISWYKYEFEEDVTPYYLIQDTDPLLVPLERKSTTWTERAALSFYAFACIGLICAAAYATRLIVSN